jgi:hypothetical protein
MPKKYYGVTNIIRIEGLKNKNFSTEATELLPALKADILTIK